MKVNVNNVFFCLDNPDVILETIKKAEKSEALILRLYNASSGEQPTTLTPVYAVKHAKLTNMLEQESKCGVIHV